MKPIKPKCRPAGTDFLRYFVRSESDKHIEYLVDLGEYAGVGFCTCYDFQFRRQPHIERGKHPPGGPYCKHIEVARKQFLREIIPRFIKERESLPAYNYEPWKGPAAISERKMADLKAYMKIRNAFLRHHPYCAVYPEEEATHVHHMAGRAGLLLFNTDHFLSVSVRGHRFIHDNPDVARQRGWMVSKGQWNKQEPHGG